MITRDDLAIPEKLRNLFHKLHIDYANYLHAPIFSADNNHYIKSRIPGAHTKNLFLTDKKGKYVLITLLGDKKADIQSIRKYLKLSRLSFASDEDLEKHLKIKPGHVTPFCVLNNEAKNVLLILDDEMMQHEYLNFHPFQNNMTTTISSKNLHNILKYLKYDFISLKIPIKQQLT